MAVKFPSAAKVKAINKTLRERAALVGFTAFMPDYSYLILDPEGRYIAQAWRDQVDKLIFEVLCPNYLIPIHDASKWTKTEVGRVETTISAAQTSGGADAQEVGKNVVIGKFTVKSILNNMRLLVGYAPTPWLFSYESVDGCVNTLNTETPYGGLFYYMTPPRAPWLDTNFSTWPAWGISALSRLMHQTGETEFIPANSPDFDAWLAQRKRFLDVLIYLPDTRKDCGNKKDSFSVRMSCNSKTTITWDDLYRYYNPDGSYTENTNHAVDENRGWELTLNSNAANSWNCARWGSQEFHDHYYQEHKEQIDSVITGITAWTDYPNEIEMFFGMVAQISGTHTNVPPFSIAPNGHIGMRSAGIPAGGGLPEGTAPDMSFSITPPDMSEVLNLQHSDNWTIYDYGDGYTEAWSNDYASMSINKGYRPSFFFPPEVAEYMEYRVHNEGYTDITALLSFKDW